MKITQENWIKIGTTTGWIKEADVVQTINEITNSQQQASGETMQWWNGFKIQAQQVANAVAQMKQTVDELVPNIPQLSNLQANLYNVQQLLGTTNAVFPQAEAAINAYDTQGEIAETMNNQNQQPLNSNQPTEGVPGMPTM